MFFIRGVFAFKDSGLSFQGHPVVLRRDERKDFTLRINQKTRFIVYTGVFSALAFLLYLFEIPLFSQYLKIDLSDLPAAVAAVMLGPAAGVAVEFVKNLLHVIIRGFGDTMGFGDLINFIVGTALIVPYSWLMRRMLKRGRKIVRAGIFSGLAGLVCMVAVGIVGNYLIAPPYFQLFLHITLAGAGLWGAIWAATILNVIKSVMVAVLITPITAALRKHSQL